MTYNTHILFMRILPLACCLFFHTACENKNNPVPRYPVYLDLDIPALYPHFVPANGFQTMTFTQKRYDYELVGYAGVLVWISMDGKYWAADLCCPRCLDPQQPVIIDGFFAECNGCGEQFDLSYGLANPVRGKTKHPLRPFGTRISGSVLQIRD